jgi:hypothetical protein
LPDGVRFIKGDIKDAKIKMRLFTDEKFNYNHHLAAYAAKRLSPPGPDYNNSSSI